MNKNIQEKNELAEISNEWTFILVKLNGISFKKWHLPLASSLTLSAKERFWKGEKREID